MRRRSGNWAGWVKLAERQIDKPALARKFAAMSDLEVMRFGIGMGLRSGNPTCVVLRRLAEEEMDRRIAARAA